MVDWPSGFTVYEPMSQHSGNQIAVPFNEVVKRNEACEGLLAVDVWRRNYVCCGIVVNCGRVVSVR
jgi:hypothetical protein